MKLTISLSTRLCSTALFLCFAHQALSAGDGATESHDRSGPAQVGRRLTTGLGDSDQELLLEAAFYEKNGELQTTDTRLRFANGAFRMDRARYQATIAARLGDPHPIEYRFRNQRLAFTPAPLRWAGPSGTGELVEAQIHPVPGRLIANGEQVEGKDDPELADKGVLFENAYGEGLHLGVLTKNLVFRKIVRFDTLASLGTVPSTAEFLEVPFELETDEGTTFTTVSQGKPGQPWDGRGALLARDMWVELGNGDQQSSIRPAHAWDSSGHRISLTLELKREGERLFLTKRIPVSWLGQAVFPVYADVDLVFGSAVVFNAADTNYIAAAALDSTHVLIAYEDGGGFVNGRAVVGTVSGNTVSFGTPATFETVSVQYVSVAALDSTHVVIAYQGSSLFGTAIVGTISGGNSISFGTASVFAAATTFATSTTALDATHALIAYRDATNSNFGTAIVGTVSGTNLSFGSPMVFSPSATGYLEATTLDATHVAIAYRDDGNAFAGTAIVGTISGGNVLSYGTPVVFGAAGIGEVTAAALDATHVFIGYSDGTNQNGTGIVATVSGGNVLSFGVSVLCDPGIFATPSATRLDSTHVAIAYGGNEGATAVVATISVGDKISYGSLVVFEWTITNYMSATALDSTGVVFAYQDLGNASVGTAIVGRTHATVASLIGFETGDASEVLTLGSGSSVQSGTVRPGSGSYALQQASIATLVGNWLDPNNMPFALRFSFRKPVNPGTTQFIVAFSDYGGLPLWNLELTPTGQLQVSDTGSVGLSTVAGAAALTNDVWYTIRVVYDANAGGVLRVWLSNSLQIDTSHSNLSNPIGVVTVDGLAAPNEYFYDDIYVAYTTSTPPPGQIVRLAPNGAGALTQFDTAIGVPTHYMNVDEVPPSPADYNQHTATTVATDLYALEDSRPGTLTINAVKGMWRMQHGTGGSGSGTHDYAWRINGNNRNLEFVGLGTTFTTKEVVWGVPPEAGGGWTTARVDGLELGATHNGTLGADTFISWAAAMVDYDDGTTQVTLSSFTATGHDGGVTVEWQTASELDNLGFNLYRATAEEGPYEKLTPSLIPGLGSSPSGARYSYRDHAVANGTTYFYELEDVDTSGRTRMHGPVSALPQAGVVDGTFHGGDESGEPAPSSLITFGDPSANAFRVVDWSGEGATVELITEGFYAEPLEDGSVRLEIPDFEPLRENGSPSLPVRRPWVDAVSGVGVRLVSVRELSVERFSSLTPSAPDSPELVATRDGIVRAGRSSRRARIRLSRDKHLYPSLPARLLATGFQGELKRVQLEMAPLRWDAGKEQLRLSRRLLVRLAFSGRAKDETSRGRFDRSSGRRTDTVLARLATLRRGLQVVAYEQIFGSRPLGGLSASSLRLSRLGEPVPFHLEPDPSRFAPGSRLYFFSLGPDVNPYGNEAVYELDSASDGITMDRVSASPSGQSLSQYWSRSVNEVNRYYQAGLLDAPDLWLWDVLLSPVTKSYSFELDGLVSTTEPARLSVFLQGASDFDADPDHHIRVLVNGQLVGETSWNGKEPRRLDAELTGLLHEGNNSLTIENVGDTAAAYSMVFLDKFTIDYPRSLSAHASSLQLEASFSQSGVASVPETGGPVYLVDTTDPARPAWLDELIDTADSVRFRAQAGHSYLVAPAGSLLNPEIRRPAPARLKSSSRRADYLVIAPEAFLDELEPLLELRRSQGLATATASIEQVYEEFGFGEARPEAIRDFIAYAFHQWPKPTLRYVLLAGDGTYDFKDTLGTGVSNQIPPYMVKTSYLWTASDPTLAAVNGDDLLPDLAIGRLPAANKNEVRAMVRKILAFENGGGSFGRAPLVLFSDNPDSAGDFDADVQEIANGVLSGKNVQSFRLSRLGTDAMKAQILRTFDDGASLVSYVGHGGIPLWANENIFNSTDVAALSPQSQQPLLVTMNCLNGYFHFPYFNSLAEELLKAEDRGVIAAFSPSGLSLDAPARLFQQALLDAVFNRGHHRLGDAVMDAQKEYASSGAFPELLAIYHLFGDPALSIHY